MNANNLMAVAQPQAAPQGAKPGRVARTSGSTSKDSFDEALGRLKEAARKTGGVPKDDSPQGKDSMTDSGGARDSVPQDPLAAALAASQQSDAGKAQDTAAEKVAAVQETAAAVVDFSAEAQARTAEAVLPQEQPQVQGERQNLQALVPQSAEAASQSKDFLAMLSGQQLSSREPGEQPQSRQTPLQLQLASLGQAGEQAVQQEQGSLGQALRGRNDLQMPVDDQAGPQVPVDNQADLKLPVGDQAGPQVPVNNQADLKLPVGNQAGPQTPPGGQAGPQMPLSSQDNPQLPPDGRVQQAAAQPAPGQQAATGQIAQSQDSAATAAASLQQATAPEQTQAAAGSVKQPQGETVAALFGEATVEETVREPDPLRLLHQQGMMQQGTGQGDGQSRQELPGRTAASMAEAAERPPEAAAETERAPVYQPGHGEAAGVMTSFRQEVQAAARTTEAPAMQQPETDFEVPRQIVEQARLIRSGGDTEMVIHLKPEHLGDLTLRVSVSSTGAVTASFHSDNAQVRAIIENSLVQLRQDLNNQGIKVDNVEVYAGLQDGQLPQGQGQQQAWQGGQGNASGQGRNFSAEDFAEEAEDLSILHAAAAQGGSGENAATDGVDYRI